MEVTKTATEATLSAIHESLAQLSVTLSRMAARQEHMLVVSKKMTEALAPTATTTPTFVPGRVPEQQTTKPLSPSFFSANQVVVAGAPHAEAVFASTTHTRCSTLGSAVNVRCNHVVLTFPTSGTTNLPATTSIDAGNNTLQVVGEAGVNTPIGCSPHVLSWPQDDPVAPVRDVDTDMPAEVLTHIGGLSLFLELCVDAPGEVFEKMALKEVVWDEVVADSVLTHIGSSSLFLELDTGTNQELQCHVDSTHGIRVPGVLCGTMIIRIGSYGYEFHSNQQSKLHCAKSEFLMLPSKYLRMPWDPCGVHALCASPVQSIRVAALKTPWDFEVLKFHKIVVLYVSRPDNLGARWSCVILRHEYAIAWGQAMFFGGDNVMSGLGPPWACCPWATTQLDMESVKGWWLQKQRCTAGRVSSRTDETEFASLSRLSSF